MDNLPVSICLVGGPVLSFLYMVLIVEKKINPWPMYAAFGLQLAGYVMTQNPVFFYTGIVYALPAMVGQLIYDRRSDGE